MLPAQNVVDEIRILANLCEPDAPNDAGKLQSDRWHLRTDAMPLGAMTKPQSLVASSGDREGEIDLQWEPVYGRDTCIGEHAAAATGS